MSRVEREYILYCDESLKDGPYYSNFYGGLLVGASCVEAVSERLAATKARLNLHGELKWQKVTAQYLEKYKGFVDALFAEVEDGHVKLRIMFRQNARRPGNLTSIQVDQSFYILYYQFIKHGFGFGAMPRHEGAVRLRAYFDQFPDTGEQVARFRGFILGLNRSRQFLQDSRSPPRIWLRSTHASMSSCRAWTWYSEQWLSASTICTR